jgi:hypothetical protein
LSTAGAEVVAVVLEREQGLAVVAAQVRVPAAVVLEVAAV